MDYVGYDSNVFLLAVSAVAMARCLGLSLLRRKPIGVVAGALGAVCMAWLTATRPTFPVPDPAKASVLITGASRGIGRAVAAAYADQGFLVFAGVRSEEDAASVAETGRIVPLMLDVTKSEHITAAKERILAEKDRKLVAVVANAGIISETRPTEMQDTTNFGKMIEVNYLGNVDLVGAFAPELRKNGGRIIATSSLLALVRMRGYTPYIASKAALEGYLTGIRRDAMHMGTPISVSIMRPGLTDTDLARTLGPGTLDGPADIHSRLPKDDPAMKQFFESIQESARRELEIAKENVVPVATVIPAYVHALTDPHPLAYYYTTLPHKIVTGILHFIPDHVADIILAQL
ncbi:Dehydrogenase/reductase SDR family member 9 [Hondaea fermentalgiana]|uniref:Dehydrogenase/reductase SDR family member 9 n=1 Tax=Hondaea fermentalgiana TaxID=2315210 RepID=A0A2R5GQ84_9STRA|nr:Dehydrogenase/reductase SDR family member 9 [Hondaea fermentalgiana]|eukprot:GBG31938.1 Dehydrogenase/reductase SDR family member 9 [Hondaea fermentalgiana]